MKKIFSALIILLAIAGCGSSNKNVGSQKKNSLFRFYEAKDSTILLNKLQEAVNAFAADAKSIAEKNNVTVAEPPKVIIRPNPGLLSYNKKDNAIRLTMYEQVPPPVKDYLVKFAGSEAAAKDFYGSMIYGYVPIHEMGHWLQSSMANALPTGYDNEYMANKLGVAYLRKTGKHQDLQRFYQYMKAGIKNVPPTFASTENVREFVTKNYLDIIRKNPGDYNAIQGMQVIEIMDDKTLPSFDELVNQLINR